MNRQLMSRQVILFFVIAYAWAWLFFLPLGLSRSGLGWLPITLSLPIMSVLGTMGPTIAAIATLRLTEHRWPNKRSIRDPKKFIFGLVLAIILIFVTYAALPAIAMTLGPISALKWSALFSFSFYGVSTVLGGPLFEEPGWRGFALPRLQELFGPLTAALLIGVLWWGWHLPLFLCKFWSSSSVGAYLLIVTGLSVILTFLYNVSAGSVFVMIVAHGAFNTTSRWLSAILGDADVREHPSPEIIIGIIGALVVLILVAITRGTLAAPKPSQP
jgi:uncharacterized protein